jgi:hypothetical protein
VENLVPVVPLGALSDYPVGVHEGESVAAPVDDVVQQAAAGCAPEGARWMYSPGRARSWMMAAPA